MIAALSLENLFPLEHTEYTKWFYTFYSDSSVTEIINSII